MVAEVVVIVAKAAARRTVEDRKRGTPRGSTYNGYEHSYFFRSGRWLKRYDASACKKRSTCHNSTTAVSTDQLQSDMYTAGSCCFSGFRWLA